MGPTLSASQPPQLEVTTLVFTLCLSCRAPEVKRRRESKHRGETSHVSAPLSFLSLPSFCSYLRASVAAISRGSVSRSAEPFHKLVNWGERVKGRSANLGRLAPDPTQALAGPEYKCRPQLRGGMDGAIRHLPCPESWSLIATMRISAAKRKRAGVSGDFLCQDRTSCAAWLLLSCRATPALISPVSSLRSRFCRSVHSGVDCVV